MPEMVKYIRVSEGVMDLLWSLWKLSTFCEEWLISISEKDSENDVSVPTIGYFVELLPFRLLRHVLSLPLPKARPFRQGLSAKIQCFASQSEGPRFIVNDVSPISSGLEFIQHV